MNITRKLTLKNLKLNRTRTIVTIIGIVLSVALITVVAGIYTSFNQSMNDMTVHNTGDYDLMFQGKQTQKGIQQLEENPDIQEVYTASDVGVAKLESGTLYTPYVIVKALTPNTFEHGFDFSLKEGRYPQTPDEIAVTTDYLRHASKCEVGGKLTLELGMRTMDPNVTDTIEVYQGAPINEYELPAETYYWGDNEVFTPKVTKTYTVTGIINDASAEMASDPFSACLRIYTVGNIYDKPLMDWVGAYDTYIRFTDAAEKNYKHVIGSMFGLTDEQADILFSNQLVSEEEAQEIYTIISQSSTEVDMMNYSVNVQLLSSKGIDTDKSSLLMTLAIVGFVFLMIICASVFIIRNSFSISITEKTKLYGMLASTGATSRQIRNNVLFEGFILGVIGIPLGLLLGVGVTWILVQLVNGLMGEFIGKMRFVMMVPFWALLLAAGLGILTIFFSVYSSAHRASKISPIEAIRSNTDIKISGKKKTRSFNTPRFIEKLFGVGGSIAWKNMKRSRKQYRTTVVSIVVSVAVYITIYSFVEYNFGMMMSHYGSGEYNMAVGLPESDENGKTYSLEKILSNYEKIAHLDGVQKSVVTTNYSNYRFDIPMDNVNPDIKHLYPSADKINTYLTCVVVDDAKFETLAKPMGLTTAECKNKAFLGNYYREFLERGYKDYPFLVDYKGLTLNGSMELFNYDDEFEMGEGDEALNGQETQPTEKKPEEKTVSLTIIGDMPDNFVYSVHNTDHYEPLLIISMDTYVSMLPEDENAYYYGFSMSLYSDDCDTLEEELSDLATSDMNYSGLSLMNYSKQLRQMNSIMLLIQIFIYGFIIVIVLIGLTNIFNTITTNMKMRRKEFAMLQSIGMTKHEFNRMISLESLLYTTKSLLIGLPIGIGSSVLIYFLVNANAETHKPYIFPWLAVLLSISVVMLLVWIIMRFSIKKVHKQNIIETIRIDNI